MAMASLFYDRIFRTLSPGTALFEARSELAMGRRGWNDDAWLSPIMVDQNP